MLDFNLNGWTRWTGWSQYANNHPYANQRNIDNVMFNFVDTVLKQNLYNPDPMGYNIEESGSLDIDFDKLHKIKNLTAKCEYSVPTEDDHFYGDGVTIEFYTCNNLASGYQRIAVISVSDYGQQQYVLG